MKSSVGPLQKMFVAKPEDSTEQLKQSFAAWLEDIERARERGENVEVLGFIHARPKRLGGRARRAHSDPRLDGR